MVIKFQTWLQQPKVWNFVCFVSSVVGLFCYASSCSFNNLFGKWTWWKILLYIGFSFILCLAVSFAKAWEHSTSPRLEAHMAFLLLMVTSVYSFFFDKDVKGKPDAYSLVSSAAFAIMSLGLSRLNHFGFQIDLLYFFSGVLTVQLMKIKLWLVVVGGSFSYSLIILRSTLDAPPRRGYHGPQDQDDVVIEIGSHSHSQGTSDSASQLDSSQTILTGVVNGHPQTDAPSDIMAQFMNCIEALKKENWNVIDTIFEHIGKFLKANLVDNDQIQVRQLHPDDNLVVDSLPLGIINNLRESTRLMVTAGLKKECLRAYISCRREFLNQIISTFAMQKKLNRKDNNNMEKIKCSIKALGIAERIILPNERRLGERIFEGSIPSEDMYHTLFGKRSFGIFGDLLYLTYGEKDQDIVPGGRVHPIARDVLSYIDKIYHNQYDLGGTIFYLELFSSRTVFITTITELLEICLKANSKIYSNPSLGYVFIMNNWRLIELGAKWRGLEPILGDVWFKNITIKLKQNLELYQRSSWNKIVSFLKLDINESEPSVVAKIMKDQLHSFNEHFDEICNVQSTWFVFDEQFRKQIIKSIEDILLPAYGNFVGRFQEFLGKHTYKYLKYGMFDVKERLNNLFLVRE